MAYRGVTARLPIGVQGFTGTRNQSQAGPGHFIYVEGAELDAGIIRKDGGAVLLAQLGALTSIKSLLHFNGADDSTVIQDDSSSEGIAIWTAHGDAKLSTEVFKFGPSSAEFDGVGDRITAFDFAALTFLASPLTIHFWFDMRATTGSQRWISGQTDSAINAASTSIIVQRTTGNLIKVSVGQASSLIELTGNVQYTNLTNPGLHHFALVRDNVAGLLRLFIDGNQQASAAITGQINNSGDPWSVGSVGAIDTNTFQGYIDEHVIITGQALWTANFVPPTKPTVAFGAGIGVGDTATPILAGHSWSPTVGADEDVVVLAGGGVLADPARDGSFTLTLRESLEDSREPPPYFCMGGGEDVGQPRKLFLFSKNNQVQVRLGGTLTMQALTGPPTDWTGGGNFPTFGCIHLNRMYAGGNASDPHRLYYSTILNHQDFVFTTGGSANAGSLPIYPGQGEKIVGAYSIRGALIVWKYPVGVYVVVTPDADPVTWSVQILSRSVGGVNASCLIQVENDLLYFDHTGSIHNLRATNDFGDFNTSNMSEVARIQPFMKEEVNRNKIQVSQALYYTNKRQAWFCVPRTNSVTPDLRLQIVFESMEGQQAGLPPRFFMSRRDQVTALWLRPADDGILRPAIGGEDGKIYLLDQDARNKNDVGYEIRFSTANTDLSFVDPALATRHKTGQFLEIVYEPEGEWDLLVDVFWDDIYTETVAFNMGGAGGVLGEFVLDTDTLGASGVKESRRRIAGSGRRMRLTCSNDGVNQNVSIAEFHLSFNIGDERTPE